MTLFRRFQLYLLGMVLGIIVVYYYFGKRKLASWLPEGRVLEQLMRNPISTNPFTDCQLACMGLDTASIDSILVNASVEFDKSEPRREPCPVYQIEGTRDGKNWVMRIESCPEHANLISLEQNGTSCVCD